MFGFDGILPLFLGVGAGGDRVRNTIRIRYCKSLSGSLGVGDVSVSSLSSPMVTDSNRCIADLHLLPMDFGCMQLVHFYPLEALPKPPPAPRPMSQIQGTRVQPIQQMRRRPETALLSLGNLEALGSTQVHALGAPRAFLDQLVHLLAHAFIHGQSLSTPIGPLYETRFRARPSSNYGTIPA